MTRMTEIVPGMPDMSPEFARSPAGRSFLPSSPVAAVSGARQTAPGIPARGATAGRGRRRPGARRHGAVAVAAAAVAVTLAACGSSGAAAKAGGQTQTVTIAAVPSEGAAGLYIALEKGMFAKAGLKVKVQPAVASTAVIPAMLGGKVDVDYGAYTAYIGATAAGVAKLRVVAPGFSLGPHVQEIIVSTKSHIKSVAQLKGKTIAVNVLEGIESDLLDNALAAYGITPTQVHLVAVPFPLMAKTLASGHVDAILANEPFVTETVKEDQVQELADIDSGPNSDFDISGYGVLASWAQKNPQTAATFTKIVEQGNAIAATHLKVLQQAMTKELKLSPDITGVMATGTFPTTVNAVQLQRVANLMLKYGQLKHSFDVKTIIGS
jgi:NitT/TauT family transport system substrate-binding protein